jgi:branched-chain amino acid transport system substrate-binding protein
MRTRATSVAKLVALALVTVLALAGLSGSASAQEGRPDAVRISIFSFLTGPFSPYGVPAKEAADVIIEDINKRGGIRGVPIRATFVDEAQGLQQTVSEFRRMARDVGVHAQIAALSSGHCLALAPIADELQSLMVMWNCDAHTAFEGKSYRYVFRTGSNTVAEFTAAAVYVKKMLPDVKTVAIMNPDYAFGHDARDIFLAALRRLMPEVQVVAELFSKLGQPDFSTEISRLAALRPDLVFSNLWGGDLNTFIRQAAGRKLFERSRFLWPVGEASLQILGKAMPEGQIIGTLGDGWGFSHRARQNPANADFMRLYRERTGRYPSQQGYKMVHAILALKQAYEQALDENPRRWPTTADVAGKMRNLELKGYTGPVRVRQDGDGLVDQLFGFTKHVPEHPFAVLDNVIIFPAEMVSPPVGMYLEWPKTLSPELVKKAPEPVRWTPWRP